MRNEVLFYVLEGAYVPFLPLLFLFTREKKPALSDNQLTKANPSNRMILYPAILLTIFAPGFFFPEMGPNKISPASADVNAPTTDSESNAVFPNESKPATPEEGTI